MNVIRRAEVSDIPALAALLCELFSQEAEFKPDLASQERGLKLILEAPGSGRLLIAQKGGRPAGMVNLIYVVSTALGARVAILEDMIVTVAARGSGLGGKLLTEAIRVAKADGCRRITLLTDEGNTKAHAFYERAGFTRSVMVPYRLMLEP